MSRNPFEDFFGGGGFPRRPQGTHNVEGVRVEICEHGSDVPPRGWCVRCDKPRATPCTHRAAKVRFEGATLEDGEVRAFGIAKERAALDLGWELLGWITSDEKRIAVVCVWSRDDQAPVMP